MSEGEGKGKERRGARWGEGGGGRFNIKLKENEELLHMKAEAREERHSMAVWEGEREPSGCDCGF